MEVRQILLRSDTAANWLSVDPVLGAGEIGTELDTLRLKIGDGTTAWSALPYARNDLTFSRNATTVTVGASGDDAVLPAATGSLAGVMSAADKTKLDAITTLGDVTSGGDNIFTGQNSFYNASGQVFGTAAIAEDGVVVAGRAGGTANYRVTLRPAALDGNHELTLPSRTGTVITSADTGTITSTMIADGTIVDGDISGSAAIADSKLAAITTAGKVANSATTATSANTAGAIVARDGSGNFSAGTITAALSGNAATASAFNGTRTFSVTGDVTGSVASTFSGNVSLALELAAGAIVNADINAAAAIADSKLATIASADKVSVSALNIDGAIDIGSALADSDLFVVDDGGAGTNRKAAATRITDYTFAKVSGDITIASNGTAALSSGAIVDADVNASAAIAGTKISPDFGSQNAVTSGTITGASLIPTSSTAPANGIYLPAANTVGIATDGAERLRANSIGLGVGSNSPFTRLDVFRHASTAIARFRIGTAAGLQGELFLEKTRDNTAANTEIALLNGDNIFDIRWRGSDGAEPITAAAINGQVDGTVTTGTVPAAIRFFTRNAAGTYAERMRITSGGNVLIGNTTGTNTLDVTGTSRVSTSVTTTNAYNDGTVSSDTKTIGMVTGGAVDLPGTTTNIHLRSQDFSTGWVSGNANATLSVDSAIVAPDGTTGVGKFVCADTTSASRRLYASANIPTDSATNYTYSVFVKSINSWPFVHLSVTGGTTVTTGAAATFDIINGIAINGSNSTGAAIANMGNGWWRLSLSMTANGSTGLRPKVILIGASNHNAATLVAGIVDAGVYVWGAQLTPVPAGQTTALGPYVRTDATAVTDAAGYIKINGTNTITSPAANTLALSTANTERMRITSEGKFAFGTTVTGSAAFRINLPTTGGTSAYSNYYEGIVQPDVTNNAYYNHTFARTADSAFTLGNLHHYSAGQGTLGASSTVTNQYGFTANFSLTGATNNYGFYGNISSGTGRWNFYANGTAPNYFAGDIRTNTVVTQRTAPTNSNTSVTATAASLLDGLRTGTPTANINLTLPTGTNMDAAFQDLQANQSFEWSVINLAAATHVITVVQNTDHTVVGNMDVAANSSGRFLTRKTAANTFITYRIA